MGERVYKGRAEVRLQDHVAGINGPEPGHGRTVEPNAFLHGVLQLLNR